MKIEKIEEAQKAAARFFKLANEYRRESIARKGYGAPKQSGALRRASMDLTRALAEMRNK